MVAIPTQQCRAFLAVYWSPECTSKERNNTIITELHHTPRKYTHRDEEVTKTKSECNSLKIYAFAISNQ